MVGRLLESNKRGQIKNNWGQSGFWVLVGGKSTLAPSHSARAQGNAIDSSMSIGGVYARSYPQLIHRSDPELSTIALWTARFVVLFRPETVILFDIMIVVLLAVCQRSVSVQ